MTPKVFTKKTKRDGKIFSVMVLKVENAIFTFFVEGEKVRVGTLALALPVITKESFIIVGEKFVTLARILAEKVAAECGKISLVSVAINTLKESEAAPVFMELTRQLLERT
jgi:hypothetical protein